MKDFFIQKSRSYTVEFTRESVTGDIWYFLTVGMQGNETKCRMHINKSGSWKITQKRIPFWLQKLEEDFSEAILKNEHFG